MSVPAQDGHGHELLSAEQLGERLGKDKRWVYRQVADHGLPALKLGRELCFQVVAVSAWLESHRVGEWRDEEQVA
jgi:excisionase family DNA binding protein